MSQLDEFIAHVQEATIGKVPIKTFSGRILGFIEYKPNGDQELKNYSGMILGTFNATRNITQNYSGNILAYGNTLSMLLKDEK